MNYCNKQTSEALIELGMKPENVVFYYDVNGLVHYDQFWSIDSQYTPLIGLLEAAQFIWERFKLGCEYESTTTGIDGKFWHIKGSYYTIIAKDQEQNSITAFNGASPPLFNT